MLKRGVPVFSLLFLTASLSGTAHAREWTIVGPRALGMGGANVAVANDSTASYWNPAAYGFFKNPTGGEYGKRKWSAALDAGVGAQVHDDLGEEVNKIMEVNFSNLNSGVLAANNVGDFIKLVNELKTFNSNPNRALTVNMNAGLSGQLSHFGLAGYAFSEVSAKGNIDLLNISPIPSGSLPTNIITSLSTTSNLNNGSSVPAGNFYFSSVQKTNMINTISALSGWSVTTATNYVQAVDYGLSQAVASGKTIPDATTNINNTTSVAQIAGSAASGGSIVNNTSALVFKGLTVAETPLTYGYAVTEDFAIGGNIKYMRGRTYNTSVRVFDTKFSTALKNAEKDHTDSSNFGLDLGMLYRFGDSLRAGVVGRNLNSPDFDMKPLAGVDTGTSLKEKAQVRAGIAYKPFSFLLLAVDYDLTKNDTTVSDSYKSQNLGGGLELNLFKFLQIRAGAFKNMAKSDIGVAYTAGLGLNLWAVNIDLGVAVSPKTTTIDKNDIPKEVKGELALSTLF